MRIERTMAGRGEQLFDQLAGGFISKAGLTRGTGFGSNPGLRVRGKIFAMMVRGALVVKLSKERVDQLVSSGAGEPFDAGKGRPMKEWVSVPSRQGRRWKELAEEAFEFVRSR